jgi:hypothetical protein
VVEDPKLTVCEYEGGLIIGVPAPVLFDMVTVGADRISGEIGKEPCANTPLTALAELYLIVPE